MAWTSVGFDGTINEAQWSQMAGLLGNDYVAAASGDCVVTAVPGARSVSVAAGSLYGDGVVSTNSGAETVAMTTPVNGQWYVIALRRTWSSNTAALVAIAGATTTTTTPTAPPTSFPTLNTNQGVLTDQPIAWAWCNSANTTVVIYDIRKLAVKSFPAIVASSAERDAKFMSPVQGTQVWRNDLGTVETYYGLYNASTNPGGLDVAGWTSNDRQVGLRAIQPSSVVVASGSGSASAQGVLSFTNATTVSLNNVFSSEYRNYKIVIRFTPLSGAVNVFWRMRAASSDYSGTGYAYAGSQSTSSSLANVYSTGSTSGTMVVGYGTVSSVAVIEVTNPAVVLPTNFVLASNGHNGAGNGSLQYSGLINVTNQFDGITFYTSASSISGEVQVFGYND